jgi:hypothetical protein
MFEPLVCGFSSRMLTSPPRMPKAEERSTSCHKALFVGISESEQFLGGISCAR